MPLQDFLSGTKGKLKDMTDKMKSRASDTEKKPTFDQANYRGGIGIELCTAYRIIFADPLSWNQVFKHVAFKLKSPSTWELKNVTPSEIQTLSNDRSMSGPKKVRSLLETQLDRFPDMRADDKLAFREKAKEACKDRSDDVNGTGPDASSKESENWKKIGKKIDQMQDEEFIAFVRKRIEEIDNHENTTRQAKGDWLVES